MAQALSLRTSQDWRSERTAQRYILNHVVTPTNTAAAANILGLRKTAANPDVYISHIRLHVFEVGISNAAVVGWKRAASVANGALMTAADIPDADSGTSNATLEVRTTTGSGGNLVGGTEDNQYILTHPAPAAAAPGSGTGGGLVDEWSARDLSERIRLTGDEGLILEWVTTGNTNTRFHFMIVWEEVG